MYNPYRVSLSKNTKTLKHINTFANTQKMNKPKVSFPSKGAPKPYAHKKHLHKHTHTPKCTNPTRVCLPSKKHQNPKHTNTFTKTHTHTHTHTNTQNAQTQTKFSFKMYNNPKLNLTTFKIRKSKL
jgi:hypothetical protein